MLLPRCHEDFSVLPFYQVTRSVHVFFNLNLFKGSARMDVLGTLNKKKKG
jgi:hypothetical protein